MSEHLSEHPNIIASRRKLRDLGLKHRIPPALSAEIGIAWRSALEKDPVTGSQVVRLVADLLDRLKPMPS